MKTPARAGSVKFRRGPVPKGNHARKEAKGDPHDVTVIRGVAGARNRPCLRDVRFAP
jgi:hypothetical protein